MNDKELNLDTLENADDETLRKIAADCPASEEEKERMFAMSRKIYNERTKESDYRNDMEVSGVDVYKKPIWHKFAAAAAVLVIGAGAVAGGILLKKNNPVKPPVINSRVETQTCPIGDLESCRIRISTADLEPAVFEPSDENQSAIIKALDKADWNAEKKAGFTIPNSAYSSEFSYVVTDQNYDKDYDKLAASTRPDYLSLYFRDTNNDGRVFMLRLFTDNSVLYDDGTKQERYQLDEETASTVRKNSKYDPKVHSLIFPGNNGGDTLHDIWDITAEDSGDTVDVYFPITKENLKIRPGNCRFCLGEWDQEEALTCETDPDVLGIFAQLDWNEATREVNMTKENVLVSLIFTDGNKSYQYICYTNNLVYVSCTDKNLSGTEAVMYDIPDNDTGIYSKFYGLYDKIVQDLTPNEIFSLTKLRSAMISKTGDPSLQTRLDDEDLELLKKAVTAGTWEKLPEDTQYGERIYSLNMSSRMYLYKMNVYSGNIVILPDKTPMKVPDSFITALDNISESVWKKVESQTDNSVSKEEKDELIARASKLYNDCIPRYMGFISGNPSIFYENTDDMEYSESDDGRMGYLVPGVSSIDDIIKMYLEIF